MLSRLLSYRNVNILLALILLAGAAGLVAQRRLARPEPPPPFESDEDHFLFGSIGTEAAAGVPYWIWLVLPRIFPEHLPRPGGYAALGFIAKDGHDMPIGFSRVTIGVPRVGLNCAACHTARYRRTPDDVPTVVAGGPGQTGVQGYLRFLFAAAADPRFTAGTILGEIARNHELSLLDRLLYRFAIIPATRSALLSKRSAAAWMEARAEWGRGRTDGPNVFKIALLRRPDDSTTGTADMMPVWNLKAQGKRPYWWDGSNADITEVTRSSAIASGATLEWIDRDARTWSEDNRSTRSSLRRVQSFMENLAVPKYPLAIDRELASQGQAAFAVACAKCHAPRGGPAPVVPLDQAGTDQRRLEAWTDEAATALNAHYEGRKWKFVAFRKGEGYAPIPLDGVWLRAPYLHNGSVPTLRALLERPEQRPARFFRGYDVLDGENVGFIATGPDAERVGTLVDTSLPGNSNSGHLYGSDLPPHSKRALLEYLKTL